MTPMINMPSFKMDIKFLEIIVNLVREQNEQLLSIISEEEHISKKELAIFIPTKFELKAQLLDYLNRQKAPLSV